MTTQEFDAQVNDEVKRRIRKAEAQYSGADRSDQGQILDTSNQGSGIVRAETSGVVLPKESGRFYWPDGRPCESIDGKNGKPRPPHIGDARKLGLRPSVTTVLRIAAKPGLEIYKQRQVMLSAMTMPREAGETDEEFCDRILFESAEQGRIASERGKELHAAIEMFIRGESWDQSKWGPHVTAVRHSLKQQGIELTGNPEKTFCHEMGYAGKIDFHNSEAVIDFKTRDLIDDKKKLGFDDHIMQLAAYAHGIELPKARMISVFIGASDAAVRIREWPEEDCARGWEMFCLLFQYWKKVNRI